MPRATAGIGNVEAGPSQPPLPPGRGACPPPRRAGTGRPLVGVGAPRRRRRHVDVLLLPERDLGLGRELGGEPHDPRLVFEVDDGNAHRRPHRVLELGQHRRPRLQRRGARGLRGREVPVEHRLARRRAVVLCQPDREPGGVDTALRVPGHVEVLGIEPRERALRVRPADRGAHLREHVPRHVVARDVDVGVASGVRLLQRLASRRALGDTDPRVAPLQQQRRQHRPHGVEVLATIAGVERLDHDAAAELRRVLRVADQHARRIRHVRLRDLHGPSAEAALVGRRLALHEELLLHVAGVEPRPFTSTLSRSRGRRRLRRPGRESRTTNPLMSTSGESFCASSAGAAPAALAHAIPDDAIASTVNTVTAANRRPPGVPRPEPPRPSRNTCRTHHCPPIIHSFGRGIICRPRGDFDHRSGDPRGNIHRVDLARRMAPSLHLLGGDRSPDRAGPDGLATP